MSHVKHALAIDMYVHSWLTQRTSVKYELKMICFMMTICFRFEYIEKCMVQIKNSECGREGGRWRLSVCGKRYSYGRCYSEIAQSFWHTSPTQMANETKRRRNLFPDTWLICDDIYESFGYILGERQKEWWKWYGSWSQSRVKFFLTTIHLYVWTLQTDFNRSNKTMWIWTAAM